jgi:hypothetical protein
LKRLLAVGRDEFDSKPIDLDRPGWHAAADARRPPPMTPGLYCGRAEPDSLPPTGSEFVLAVAHRHHVMSKGEICFTDSSRATTSCGKNYFSV